MRQPKYRLPVLLLTVAGALTVRPAYAHGFGERYDLPVPLWLYVTGAGAAVALSFVVIGVFVRGMPGLHSYPRFNLLRWRFVRALGHPALLVPIKLASVTLFLLTLVAGLAGDQDPTKNLAPTMVWVIWWIGIAYVSALLGNIWALISPWKILFEWGERLYKRLNQDGDLAFHLPYPPKLGVWPGVLLFLAFAWTELAYPRSADPSNIALLAILYSIITWGGMLIFGKEVWLRHGEAFSLAFGFLARFAPSEVRVVAPEVCDGCTIDCRDRAEECVNCYECFFLVDNESRQFNLRPLAAGLLGNEVVSPSMMAFVILLLSTVTFDGFTATPVWGDIQDGLFSTMTPLFSINALAAIDTLGLLLFPAIFLVVYLLFSLMMSYTSGSQLPISNLARLFVYSLIPIALAYHLAHYLTFIIIQGQLIIPLASDPFGYGWDLLSTADYRVNIGIVDARFAWFTAVVAIVAGHIIAVYLAHVIAIRTMNDQRAALRSQYPMLTLMVMYTVISLWIIAQPIVERT